MLYAAYGSNLHPLRLSLRLPGSRFLGAATVADRQLCFHKRSVDKSGKCNITVGTGRVYVAIYELDRYEKSQLDQIEGAGAGYTIETIDVPGFGECFTYIAELSYIDDSLLPYSWYKSLVLAGCKALAFPADYLIMIDKIPTIDDPDEKRHADNMKIVELAIETTNAVSIEPG